MTMTEQASGIKVTTTNGANRYEGSMWGDTFFADGGDVGTTTEVFGYGGDDRITATGTGRYTIDGGSGNDHIEARFGDATIQGGSGNDTIVTGQGKDTITGGIGDDSI